MGGGAIYNPTPPTLFDTPSSLSHIGFEQGRTEERERGRRRQSCRSACSNASESEFSSERIARNAAEGIGPLTAHLPQICGTCEYIGARVGEFVCST